jgi:hypothetical protein
VSSQGSVYSGSSDINAVGWYRNNSSGAIQSSDEGGCGTWPIGLKTPNELGFYDMTGNVELVPCKSIDAEELARSYLQIFGRYGASQYIKTDNAAVMESDLIKQFIELIKSEYKHSISHRHESNGVIEHSNKETIRHLKAVVHELKGHKRWSKYTMIAQRIINATISSVTKVSPSQ